MDGGHDAAVALVSLEPSRQLEKLADALAAAGCRPVVVTAAGRPARAFGTGRVRYRTVAVDAPPTDSSARLREFAAGVRDVLGTERPDMVHTVGWPAGLSARGLDLESPRVHSFRAPAGSQLLPHLFGSDRQQVERAAIGRAQRVLVESEPARDVAHRLGASVRRVSVVPPGVDLDVFHPAASAMGREVTGRLILAAEHPERFPLRTVLRAIPGVELLLLRVGDRPTVDVPGAHREEFGERLRFVDAADPDRRASVLRSADLLVCCDPPEGARGVPMEAMACGVPVVACCPDSVDAVQIRVTGINALHDTPHQLARSMRQLLADPVIWQAMSSGAIDRAQSRYGWARVAADTARVYRELLFPPVVPTRGRGSRPTGYVRR